jgi:hypothetical protein
MQDVKVKHSAIVWIATGILVLIHFIMTRAKRKRYQEYHVVLVGIDTLTKMEKGRRDCENDFREGWQDVCV